MSESATPLHAPVDIPDPPGKLTKTIGYYACLVALGLVVASLGPTLPGLAAQTGAALSQISYLFLARSTGYLTGSLLLGRLYDRVPGHPLMAGMLVVMAVTMALVPLTPMLWVLIAILFVLGIGEGTLDVGGNTLLVRVHLHNLDPYMNALHFFFGVGAMLSPFIVVRVMAASGGIAWAYWTLALMIVPVAVWIAPLSSPRVQAVSRDGTVRRGRPLFIVWIAACFFLCVGAEAGFGGWIYTYAIRLGLADEIAAGDLTTAFWGALTLGRLLGIPVSARLRPRTILLADLVGCLLSVGLILTWPNSSAALWAGTVGGGLFVATMFATLLNFAGRHITITGRVTGWFFVGTSTGAMSIPWLIGQFFESAGPQSTMYIIGADLVLGLGVFWGLMQYAKRRGLR